MVIINAIDSFMSQRVGCTGCGVTRVRARSGPLDGGGVEPNLDNKGQQKQRAMKGEERHVRWLAIGMRTATLTAISLHAFASTSCALTTSLTASSCCCTRYTLCYSEVSPLAASDEAASMQEQRAMRQR